MTIICRKLISISNLGIWIKSWFRWDSHINYIVGKANRVLGLIRRTFGSKDPVAVKTACNVLVRRIRNMHAQCGTHIWLSTFTVLNPSSLVLLDWYVDQSNLTLKGYLNLTGQPLDFRRKYLCLVQLYKIIHGYSDVDYTRYIDLTGPTRTRRNHNFKIRPRAARTNYFKFSFFNRYVNDWNSLPNSVMSASSLNVFKNRLFNYHCT